MKKILKHRDTEDTEKKTYEKNTVHGHLCDADPKPFAAHPDISSLCVLCASVFYLI
jgi:hypothetical protein